MKIEKFFKFNEDFSFTIDDVITDIPVDTYGVLIEFINPKLYKDYSELYNSITTLLHGIKTNLIYILDKFTDPYVVDMKDLNSFYLAIIYLQEPFVIAVDSDLTGVQIL